MGSHARQSNKRKLDLKKDVYIYTHKLRDQYLIKRMLIPCRKCFWGKKKKTHHTYP